MKDITIVTSRYGGPKNWGSHLKKALEKKGYKVQQVHSFLGALQTFLSPGSGILHTTVPFPFTFWRGPIIATIHGEYKREKYIYRKGYEKLLRVAQVVTTPSKFMRKLLPRKQVEIIPNAILPQHIKPNRKKYHILTIMNLDFPDKVKGVKKIITALENSRFANEIVYTILGSGAYLEEVKAQAKQSNITIRVPGRQNIAPYLAEAEVFAYYSEHDNFPLVLLEAMEAKLPVITNGVGAVKEFIEHRKTGFIVKEKEYAQVLDSILSNKQLQENIGKEAHKVVRKQYSWETIVNKYIELYSKL